jgi:hypothetical protein
MERATIDTHSRKYVKIHSAATFGSYAALQAPFAAEWAVGVSSLNSTKKEPDRRTCGTSQGFQHILTGIPQMNPDFV